MAVQFGGTVLLLHMDGSPGNQFIPDSSPIPLSIQPQGNVTFSTAQSKFGQSLYFDGSGDWLYLTSLQTWDFLKRDFTIEFWVYFEDLNTTPHIVNLGYNNTNRLTVYWAGGFCKVFTNVSSVAADRIVSSQPSSTGVWEHWALVKSGVTTTLYKDGAVVGSAVNMPMPPYRSDITLGIGYQHLGSGLPGDYLKGYLDEFHVVDGVAVYTAPFTPPSAPLGVNPGVSMNTVRAGDYILGRGSANFNATPIFQRKMVDLRDRAPFGLPVTTSETLGPYSALRPWQFKGRGRIAGTVKEKASPTDKPVSRRVRLYREPDGRLVRTVWSDPVTGAYEFYGIPMDARYTVVSHDYLSLYRAVLADNLVPELIP